MITPQQSRSARAWLDWSRADLSRLSGVSSPAITEFETGRSNPGLDTMEKLFVTYTGAGIEFTSNGLKYNRDRLLWLDDYSALLDDIMLLRPKEALFMNADDAKSSPAIRKREQELQSLEISLRFVAPLTGQVGVKRVCGVRLLFRVFRMYGLFTQIALLSGRRIEFC